MYLKFRIVVVIAFMAVGRVVVAESAAHPPASYDEPYRPQFHITPPAGWMNDPNGLVYYDGEYHLFYLWNPNKRGWGECWRHAVSKDLVHWELLGTGIDPHPELGVAISGSAIVDQNNISGLQTGKEQVLLAFPTTSDKVNKLQTLSMAYSNDRGRTWKFHDECPILETRHRHFRDAKVLWYGPEKKWIMLVCRGYTVNSEVYESRDLKNWKKVGHAPPGEVPDMFELPIVGCGDQKKWVHTSGDYNRIRADKTKVKDGGKYFVGQFDGASFNAESELYKFGGTGGNFFVGASFNGVPDGRRIFIGWKWIRRRGVLGPWSGGILTIPVELTLQHVPDLGLRLFQNPIQELQALRGQHYSFRDETIAEGNTLLSSAGIRSELLEILVEFKLESATEFGLHLRKGKEGPPQCMIIYDVDARKLKINPHHPDGGIVQPLSAKDGTIHLHILLDRSVVDVFGNDGLTWNCDFFKAEPGAEGVELFAKGGDIKVVSLDLWKLHSSWDKEKKKRKTEE